MALTSSRVTISSAIALSNPRLSANAPQKGATANPYASLSLYNNSIKMPSKPACLAEVSCK
jgi:hypothetical protein